MQLSSPAHPELQQLFSASSVLPAVAEAAAVKTGSGLAGTFVELAAPSAEPVVSLVRVAAAEEPKIILVMVKRTQRSTHGKSRTNTEK